ncbi:hypothetical protein [Spirulina subsalsa]|uniref:hypothetical protein n=1 Tax=Spirulina subsalsa TaxID=54311 RepID=UPI0003160010|nr:hypothetical protein [Spirulina subsalsa]
METQNNEPRATDAVLGGYSPPPVDAAVLGGLEGLTQRLSVNLNNLITAKRQQDKLGSELVTSAIEAHWSDLKKSLIHSDQDTPKALAEVTLCPQDNSRWVHSIDLDLDEVILGEKIVAYRIQWFSGHWSCWYVPGINDLYQKQMESLRRVWAHFNDHNHQYIAIPREGKPNLRSFAEFDQGLVPKSASDSQVKMVEADASSEMRWAQNLDLNLDQDITGHKIIAYQLQGLDGEWLGWFVPGYRDIYTATDFSRYRLWAYFGLLNHRYLYQG